MGLARHASVDRDCPDGADDPSSSKSPQARPRSEQAEFQGIKRNQTFLGADGKENGSGWHHGRFLSQWHACSRAAKFRPWTLVGRTETGPLSQRLAATGRGTVRPRGFPCASPGRTLDDGARQIRRPSAAAGCLGGYCGNSTSHTLESSMDFHRGGAEWVGGRKAATRLETQEFSASRWVPAVL